MAAAKKKRGAENYLTDQNWDRDEDIEPEEAGSFISASEDVLAKRSFKKAKRRANSSETGEAKANPFAAFGGFGGGAAPTFNFGAKPSDPTTAAVNKPAENKAENNNTLSFWKTADTNKDFFASRGEQEETTKVEDKIEQKNTEGKSIMKDDTVKTTTTDNAASNDNCEDTYFDQLSSLNHSVLAWIKKHVETNPCIDLTPVFKDYEKHMKEIETDYGPSKKTGVNGTLRSTNVETNTKTFKTPEGSVQESTMVATSSAIHKPTPSVFASSTPIQGNTLSAVPSFKSGNLFTSSPFSMQKEESKISNGESKPTETVTSTEGNENAEPVPERKTIVEDDAFHTIRSKLFFKKGGNWQELGVGMLYLKPANNKTQLLVRMENTTGKVLLNIALTNDLPMSRNGKNNVMIVSVPNPPVYTKATDGDNSLPCTYLIRVKGTTEADELLEKMKK